MMCHTCMPITRDAVASLVLFVYVYTYMHLLYVCFPQCGVCVCSCSCACVCVCACDVSAKDLQQQAEHSYKALEEKCTAIWCDS